MKEAELHVPLAGGKVKCLACARNCQLGESQTGFCGIRQNIGGKLQLLAYGKLFTGHIDPIEKKPVTHYHPGTKIFSVSTSGCSWSCKYCFSFDTPIVTDKGIVTIRDLFESGPIVENDGLEAIAKPPNIRAVTHKGRLENIEAVFRHPYEGEMISLTPYYLPKIRCTPNHKILATKNADSPPEMMSADVLTKGYFLAVPKLVSSPEKSNIDFAEAIMETKVNDYKLSNQKNSLELRKNIVNDLKNGLTNPEIARKYPISRGYAYTLSKRYKQRGEDAFVEGYSVFSVPETGESIKLPRAKHSGIPRILKLDERLAWLFGIYCAEGSVIESPNRPNSCVLTFSFGKHETNLIAKTQNILNELFLERGNLITQGSVTRVQVGNSTLAKAFKGLAGWNCYTKKVPSQILLSGDDKIIQAFVSGYLVGDGYYTLTSRPNYGVVGSSSASRELTLGIAYCLLRLESMPRVYVSSSSGTISLMGRTVNKSKDNIIRMLVKSCNFNPGGVGWEELANLAVVTENYILIPIRKVEREAYGGFVYNIQVAEDHTYTASFFAVSNCQNYEISQRRKVEGMDIEPADVPRLALAQGCQGIAYTYNEPTIFIEYARDIGIEAHKKGLFNVFVSNGFATPESVKMMSQFLDCITVDFKGNAEKGFVRKYISVPGAEPIFQSLIEIKNKTKVHVEITDLVIPEVGDDLSEARKLSRWVYENLGPEMPIHFLRFHPDYKMMEFPATPIATLEAHHKVAKEEGLEYVYLGNVPGHKLEHTYCHGCKEIAVKRYGYEIIEWNLDKNNRCKSCGTKIPIEGGLASTVSELRYLPAYF